MSPDVVRPVDRLVVVAERVSAYAAELQRLVAELQAERGDDDERDKS